MSWSQQFTAKVKAYIPSRGWLIFIGTTSTISSLLAYDKYKLNQVRKELTDKAALIAAEPLAFHELPRKISVYISPGDWSKYWFTEYVKPVFDAAGLDYDLIDCRKAGQVRAIVRDKLWDAKEEMARRRREEEERRLRPQRRSWSMFGRSGYDDEDLGLMGNVLRELERRPKYDSKEGQVAVGPEAWREMLQGLNDGCAAPRVYAYTDDELRSVISSEPIIPSFGENPDKSQKKEIEAAEEAKKKWVTERTNAIERRAMYPVLDRDDPSALPSWFQPPPVGYVAGRNLIGWGRFPHRIYTWFTSRYLMREAGEDALIIARGSVRPFSPASDVGLGRSDECAIAEKETGTEWEDKRAWAGLSSPVADRLSIYSS
ncbi:mitochondrial import inner membrane translocase subunit tim54 [Dinochytrium kinnereticum]|nr:mitochondrial import inner membrane translocase subunit tim54 [Dinochytrium kinnereticum]